MSQYQRLFLVADPQMQRSAALQRAAALAKASGAALHVTAFVEPFATLRWLDKSVQEQTREQYLSQHGQWLQQQVTPLREQGLAVTTELQWTNEPLAEIIRHLEEMQPDLLIKDVQHEPLLKRAFITPLDVQLLRDSPVPLMLVGGERQALPRKIMAAVDPSRMENRISGLNERIIQAANALALQCDAELHLVYVYDLSPAYLGDAGAGSVAWSDLVGELRDSLHKSFSELADSYGVAPERRHFVMGTPLNGLADFAESSGADVLVMGRVQRHGLNKLLGSTIERLLFQAPCSILAVPAP
ncbi:universal stress protein [Pseudomonas sp. SP16.1]|uniref:universal stress protein n=1 Tax=Pseudomonas sp. SP16.1 TaxID=3458854 RepID=UPI0040455B37